MIYKQINTSKQYIHTCKTKYQKPEQKVMDTVKTEGARNVKPIQPSINISEVEET